MKLAGAVVLILIAGSYHLSAESCGEVQPTLRDYRIQEMGESYVNGNGLFPMISDSEACEKIRYDLRVHHCRHKDAKEAADSWHRRDIIKTENGIPVIVKQAMNRRVVGGQAAKDRSIARARELYAKTLAETKEVQAAMTKAKAEYLEAHRLLAANSCGRGIFADGSDPFIDKRGSQK